MTYRTSFATAALLLSLAVCARPSSASFQCDDGGDVNFELLTGYTTNPSAKHVMREQLALFTLPQCIDACKSDDQCAAITYETGACVSYAAVPQKNTNPDFPFKRSQYTTHTTTVARKICVQLPKTCNQRSWSFDTVHGELKVTSKQHYKSISRSSCMDKCLNENSFQCRSVNFNKETGDCHLNDVDRFTMSGRPSIGNRSLVDADVDYMESNCVIEQPKMCDFVEVSDKLLKTVDAIYENVATMDRCKEMCLAAKEFQCRSFDYNETGANVCRISHHSTSSLSQLERPYMPAAGATTYQMSSCFGVKIDCRGTDMIASINTNRLFNGKVYAKNSPSSCVNDVNNALDFNLHLDYHNLNCDVRQDLPGKFSTEIIIQHHDQIVTGQDIGLSVRCSYDLQNRSVGQGIELAMAPATGPGDGADSDSLDVDDKGASLDNGAEETAFVISPTVMMRITNRAGGDIHAAQVGDPLSLRFHILDDRSPYEIFVRELIALDGVDTSEILLIDGDGCPTDPTIMGPITTVDTGSRGGTVKILEAPFDAFKFPTSDIVQFKALVTPCLPKCEPINCNVVGHNGAIRRTDSFGRRRRRRRSPIGNQTDEVVFQEIRIEDKFKFEAQHSDVGREISFNSADDPDTIYWNTYAFALLIVAFVLLQAFVIFACWLCVARKSHRSSACNIYEQAVSEYARHNHYYN